MIIKIKDSHIKEDTRDRIVTGLGTTGIIEIIETTDIMAITITEGHTTKTTPAETSTITLQTVDSQEETITRTMVDIDIDVKN